MGLCLYDGGLFAVKKILWQGRMCIVFVREVC